MRILKTTLLAVFLIILETVIHGVGMTILIGSINLIDGKELRWDHLFYVSMLGMFLMNSMISYFTETYSSAKQHFKGVL